MLLELHLSYMTGAHRSNMRCLEMQMGINSSNMGGSCRFPPLKLVILTPQCEA